MSDCHRGRKGLFASVFAGKLQVVLALLACPLLSRSAVAQVASDEKPVVSIPPGERDAGSATLESRFLRVEPAFWGTFGLRLFKDGRTVGPSFFSVVSDEAVRGSAEAAGHAFHGRLFQGAAIGSALAAISLLAGAVVVRREDGAWTNTAKYLGVGGIGAILVELISGTLSSLW